MSIIPSAKGFEKKLRDEIDGPLNGVSSDVGDRAGGGFASSFTGHFAKIAAVASAAFAGLAVGSFIKDSVTAASDLNESVSKVGFVFGDSAGDINDWASTAATAMGQSRQQALEAAGTFGNLFTAMKIGQPQAAGMSKNLVGLAGDLASFNNVSPQEALDALRSGLTGETEPLKRFGVNLDDATLKAKAMELGLDDGKGVLNANAKAQAAYALIMEQTGTAQGDFARTSDGLANKQRILGAQFTDIKAQLGTALLPVLQSVAGFISDKLFPAFAGLAENIGPAIDVFKAAFSSKEVTSGGFIGFLQELGVRAREVVDFVKQIDFRAVFEGAVQFITPIVDALGQLASTSFDLIKATVATLFQLFRDNQSTITTIADVVRGVLVGAFQTLSSVVGFLATHMELVKAVAVPLLAAFIAFKTVTTIITAVTAATKLWSIAQAALNIIMTLNPIGLVVAAIAALVAGVIYAYTHFEGFRNVVDGFWQVLQTVFNWVKANWPLLLAILAGPVGVAVLLIVKHFDTIKEAVTTAVDWVRDRLGEFIGFFVALPGQILGAIGDAAGWLVDKGKDIILGLINGYLAIIGQVTDFYLGLAQMVIGWVGDAASWLVGKGRDIIVGLINGYVSVIGQVTSFFAGLAGQVISWVGDAGSWLVGKGRDIIYGLINGYVSTVGTAVSYFSGLGGQVIGWVGYLGSALYGAGKDLIYGLVNGIRAVAGEVASAAREVVSGAINAAKSVLGIHSPSTVFAALGVNVSEGFVVGLNRSAGSVDAAVSNLLTTGMVGSTAPAISSGTYPRVAASSGFAAPPPAMGGGGGAPTININAPLGVDRREVIAAVQQGLRGYETARRRS